MYVGVGWSLAIGYSSIPEIRYIVGFILGPIMATPLAALHLLVQCFLRKLARLFVQLRPWPEAVVLNLPVTILMGVWIINAYHSTGARAVFERFLAKPIPSSVHVIAHGGGQVNFAEGVRVGIHFEIEPRQLQSLIHSGGFAPKEDDRGAEYWKSQFWNISRLDAPLAPPYALYFRETHPRTNQMSVSYTDGGNTSQDVVKSVQYEVDEYLFCPSNNLSVFYLRLAR